MATYRIPPTDGTTLVVVPLRNNHHGVVVTPNGTTGTLLIEGTYALDSNWYPIRTVELSDTQSFRFTGSVGQYRFTLSNSSGTEDILIEDVGGKQVGDGPGYGASEVGIQPSQDMRDNLESITVQGFTEANSKQGRQYEAVVRIPSLAGGASTYVGLTTGSDPLVIKQRDVYGGYVDADFTVYEGSAYTGGTAVPTSNNNNILPRDCLSTVSLAPTVTTEGNVFGAVTPLIGSEGVGNRTITTFGGNAGEKVLAANTQYLGKFTNNDSKAMEVTVLRLYFYEGPIYQVTI